MMLNIKIENLTLRGQLAKIKTGYGDNKEWTKLSDKELKEDFFKTLNYYKENEKKLNEEEKKYLIELENVKNIVYQKESK